MWSWSFRYWEDWVNATHWIAAGLLKSGGTNFLSDLHRNCKKVWRTHGGIQSVLVGGKLTAYSVVNLKEWSSMQLQVHDSYFTTWFQLLWLHESQQIRNICLRNIRDDTESQGYSEIGGQSQPVRGGLDWFIDSMKWVWNHIWETCK